MVALARPGPDPVPSPAFLFARATDRHPDDRQARNDLYLELLRNHGLILRGKAKPLPCRYPKATP